MHAWLNISSVFGFLGAWRASRKRDFNTECIGRERYDAGIKTRHPDLVRSAVELFEQIWHETESVPLQDFMKKGKN